MNFVIFFGKIFRRNGLPERRRGPFRETGGNFWKNSGREQCRGFATPCLRGREGGYLEGGTPLGKGVGWHPWGCGAVPVGRGVGRG